MSRSEKLRAMEALWADLSQHDETFKSPAWHETALQEAESAVRAGKAQFSDWAEAKKRIRRKAAKLG
ncbi:MAG TPA: addiction module protein [Chthoniobacterales bacterium]|nr:addiction module protein [Chthoniobacterales bacterium]